MTVDKTNDTLVSIGKSIKFRIWYFFNLVFFRDNKYIRKCPYCKYHFISCFQICCTACHKYRQPDFKLEAETS